MLKIIKIIFFSFTSFSACAQLVYNNTFIKTQKNATLKVQGGWKNAQGEFTNNGFVIIDSTFHNDTASTTQGNGHYKIQKHWYNNGLFQKDSSLVTLNGQKQFIAGKEPTHFQNLHIKGTNFKRMKINTYVHDTLDLNNLELQTGKDTLFALTEDPAAIQHDTISGDEGFISSDLASKGSFSRNIAAGEKYILPLGASTPNRRYRPLVIDARNNDTVHTAFVNTDPSNDGYNRTIKEDSICKVNEKWYHRIESDSSLDINILYKTQDGDFHSIVQWDSAWKEKNNATKEQINGFRSIKVRNIRDFNSNNFALTRLNPDNFSVWGDSLACKNSVNPAVFRANTNNLQWEVKGGEIISSHNSEAQTDSISVNMNTNGWVTAMKVDVYGCSRKSSDTVFVELQEKPDNGKIKAEDTVLDVDEIVNLIYTGESGNYKWNLGNGKTASGKSIQVIYSKKGKYIATMTTGKNGCKFIDSLQLKVIDNFKLPNVFSPNNDGMNDVYKVTADAFSNYNIIIKNRWGQTIYSHKKGEPFWNGKTKAGNKADEGTYFVVFEGVRKGEKVVRKSDLTLLR